MREHEVDLAVIGAGPAGQKGAIQSAKLDKKVVVVDRLGRLGGACLNQGTIPSKTLREAILSLTDFRERSYYGRHQEQPEISIHDLNFRVHKVIEDENALIERQFARNSIETIRGSARFTGENVLEVTDDTGDVAHRIAAERFLIATGSGPRNPLDVPFDDTTILDSDRLLQLGVLPESMLVLGGGVIGCEYGTMFAALGTRVTLIDKADGPLSHLDVGIGKRFGEYIRDMGVQLEMGRVIADIRRGGEEMGAEVETESGEVFRAQCLFYALGRRANAEGLDLEAAGLELNERGYVEVNALFQTANPSIYAAGDVIGQPSLASTAMEQGRLAARNAFALRTHQFPTFFPYGIYTIPEVSGIGPTEEELQQRGVNYQVGLAYYYEIGRGPIAGDTTGMFKLIFHAETLEVLGVHIIGSNAAELVHIGQLAIDFHARVNYFVDQVFNYPTFAEGYRIAALNGINKLEGLGRLQAPE